MDDLVAARADHPLRLKVRPAFEVGPNPFRTVDLFAGCGGLSLGIAQALAEHGRGLDVRLAVDFEEDATRVYRANFPSARSVQLASVEDIFDGQFRDPATESEKLWSARVGKLDALVGGPPCQGHSSLNNHTRGVDPKNGLYLLMARAAEVLRPAIVMIENVPAVMNDRYQGQNVVSTARAQLEYLKYKVADAVVPMHGLGVAQTRKRHILLATRGSWTSPARILGRLADANDKHDLRWAIGDLEDVASVGIDTQPRASAANVERMQYLLANDKYDLPNMLRPTCHQNEHSYKSMYGRLNWDLPAQTITSGFGSIGQGRYMHPSRLRALTAHEAARLQGFPDYFDFSPAPTRTALATMIGNAVPPQMSAAVFRELLVFQRSGALESTVLKPEPLLI